MTGKLKTAFDGIRAEDSLKDSTVRFLQTELQGRSQGRKRALLRRYAAAFACVTVMLLLGVFTHRLYFLPSAYVDVDVNPSVALTLNRFDRVIGASAYNEDGKAILEGLSLTHKTYHNAMLQLIEALDQKGYMQQDALMSVTVQTNDASRETAMLSNIQAGIEDYIIGHRCGTEMDVFSVSSDTRSHAHAQNLSPAKYLAIQELIELDPTVSMESCSNHSIGEIRQLTRQYGNHHGGATTDNGAINGDEAGSGSWQGEGHHSQGGHHHE